MLERLQYILVAKMSSNGEFQLLFLTFRSEIQTLISEFDQFKTSRTNLFKEELSQHVREFLIEHEDRSNLDITVVLSNALNFVQTNSSFDVVVDRFRSDLKTEVDRISNLAKEKIVALQTSAVTELDQAIVKDLENVITQFEQGAQVPLPRQGRQRRTN